MTWPSSLQQSRLLTEREQHAAGAASRRSTTTSCSRREHATEWTGEAGTVDTTALYSGNFEQTRRRLSDHVPVWATFNVSGQDDD